MSTHKKRNFILALLLASITGVDAQDSKMNTDRPDQTDGTSVLAPGAFQFESEVYLNTFKEHKSAIISSSLFRAGILPGLEARLVAEQGKRRDLFIDETVQGIYPLAAGVKYAFFKAKGKKPGIAIIAQIQVPVTNHNDQPDYWAPSFALAYEQKLNKFNLTMNAGGKQNAFDKDWSVPFSADLKYQLGKTIDIFGEYFAQYAHLLAPDHNVDAGMLVHVSKTFMIYGAFGERIFSTEHNYFINSGVGVKF